MSTMRSLREEVRQQPPGAQHIRNTINLHGLPNGGTLARAGVGTYGNGTLPLIKQTNRNVEDGLKLRSSSPQRRAQ